ncbi:Piso0_000751 [Millerozyma farinosa CBS 7064]|uniref:Piso0_000751 protein n=1 Tax=Pichia sorbitophila (strain ATCC MYA-4447 / BCRC 22081 / CBS 7064 / NBRC 10061 / NRRL Y-12695) TaxID=559304 RepID=G8YRE9_PICSO|nr:Piso0_000751 [Millerozyma farinosa CBS 7064]
MRQVYKPSKAHSQHSCDIFTGLHKYYLPLRQCHKCRCSACDYVQHIHNETKLENRQDSVTVSSPILLSSMLASGSYKGEDSSLRPILTQDVQNVPQSRSRRGWRKLITHKDNHSMSRRPRKRDIFKSFFVFKQTEAKSSELESETLIDSSKVLQSTHEEKDDFFDDDKGTTNIGIDAGHKVGFLHSIFLTFGKRKHNDSRKNSGENYSYSQLKTNSAKQNSLRQSIKQHFSLRFSNSDSQRSGVSRCGENLDLKPSNMYSSDDDFTSFNKSSQRGGTEMHKANCTNISDASCFDNSRTESGLEVKDDSFKPLYDHSFTLNPPPKDLPKDLYPKWERRQMFRHTARTYDHEKWKSKQSLTNQENLDDAVKENNFAKEDSCLAEGKTTTQGNFFESFTNLFNLNNSSKATNNSSKAANSSPVSNKSFFNSSKLFLPASSKLGALVSFDGCGKQATNQDLKGPNPKSNIQMYSLCSEAYSNSTIESTTTRFTRNAKDCSSMPTPLAFRNRSTNFAPVNFQSTIKLDIPPYGISSNDMTDDIIESSMDHTAFNDFSF